MSDIYYRSPLDDLYSSPLIRGRDEINAENFVNQKQASQANKNASFQDTLTEVQTEQQNKGCNELIPISCDDSSDMIQDAKNNIKEQVNNSLENILNSSKIAYKKKLPFIDPKTGSDRDNTPGPLMKTNWQLDLSIDGTGKGFKLMNGQFTRDGRFKFNEKGQMVTLEGNIPLEICFVERSPVDWSLKQLEINEMGEVFDKLNGQKLGKIAGEWSKESKIRQYHLEKANINLPLEFMGLQQKLRLVDLSNSTESAGIKLDAEAVQNLGRL